MSVQLLKAELELKQHSLEHLRSLSQGLLCSVKNKEVAQKVDARLENFNQRWYDLQQLLEKSSTQVCIYSSLLVMVLSFHQNHEKGS